MVKWLDKVSGCVGLPVSSGIFFFFVRQQLFHLQLPVFKSGGYSDDADARGPKRRESLYLLKRGSLMLFLGIFFSFFFRKPRIPYCF